MVYTTEMADLIKRPHFAPYAYGDIVRLTAAIKGSKGKRYKFVGAVFDPEDSETPLYLDLIEIGRGQMRAIRPEFVVKDIPASKAAQARIARKAEK